MLMKNDVQTRYIVLFAVVICNIIIYRRNANV